MKEFRSPGLYFERADSRSYAMERSPTHVVGFLGLASQGPIHVPVHLTSWRAFQDTFGAHTPDSFLAYAVFGFFNNGGTECHVVRVAHGGDPEEEANACRAHLTLKDRRAEDLLRVDALHEGVTGNSIRVRMGAASRVRRTALAAPLLAGDRSATLESARGFHEGSVVRLSDEAGSEYRTVAAVRGPRVEWERPLGRSYPDDSTLVETAAFSLAVSRGGEVERYDDLSMDPRHPRFVEEAVNRASRLVRVRLLREAEAVEALEAGAGGEAGPAGPDPGEEEPAGDVGPEETFVILDADEFERVLPARPHPDDEEGRIENPYAMTAAVEAALRGGRDGQGRITAADFIGGGSGPAERRGLAVFEEVEEVGLLAAPDLHMAMARSEAFGAVEGLVAVQQAMVAQCERFGDRFAVLDPPEGLSPEAMLDYRARFDTSYAAIYYPWLRVMDPLDLDGSGTRLVPATGHVLGIYSDQDLRLGVHKAPANVMVEGGIALERPVGDDLQAELNVEGVNCLRVFPGRGLRVWGARTLSSDSQWRFINVRRLFIMIEQSVRHGLQWTVFEPNGPMTWKAITRTVGAFLLDIWKEGYLQGQTPEEAFYVKCDEETNPAEGRDVGEVVTEIGLAAVRPAEFIVVRIGQRTRDIVTEEPVS
ncbi:MAG: phage tail sheath family protein [Planctomycetes bacterium]|nr:phage tail sheath family protein [Planctomycetota bacterium]